MGIQTHVFLGSAVAAMMAATTFTAASESLHQWSLEVGFMPNPRTAEVAAGGPVTGDCGYLPHESQLVIDYAGGDQTLGIGTAGYGVDTTLEVTTPTGDILCDDDSGGGADALITLEAPKSGRYEVRVGTHSPVMIGTSVDVIAIEFIDTDAVTPETTHLWSLTAGFVPDPRTAEVAAGGPVSDDCGYLPHESQLVIDYASGDYALSIGTTGYGVDTTLEVTTPTGDVLCDDDSGDDSDALITLEVPESGRYEVRVGTYSSEMIGTSADVFTSELIDSEIAISPGTGFLVSDNHIVTNWRVIDGATGSVTVRALGLPDFEAEILVYNEENDIALLYTEDLPESLGEVVFRTRPPVSLGESIFAFGFPMSNGTFTQGSISALTGVDGDLTKLQFTAPIQPGSSGSPLFDADGHVVAMVTSRIEAGQLINFALRGTLIKIFLDSNNVDYRLTASDGGLQPSQIGAMARNTVVELVVNNGW